MYTLYHNKEDCVIKLEKAKKIMQNIGNFTEDVTCYNNNYYFCLLRSPLKQKATEMKQEWLKEAEDRAELIKNIKI